MKSASIHSSEKPAEDVHGLCKFTLVSNVGFN